MLGHFVFLVNSVVQIMQLNIMQCLLWDPVFVKASEVCLFALNDKWIEFRIR